MYMDYKYYSLMDILSYTDKIQILSQIILHWDLLHSLRFLHQRLCQATLRKDHEGQAVLINCLLRNYLHYSLYDQAQKLIVKLEFPQQVSAVVVSVL